MTNQLRKNTRILNQVVPHFDFEKYGAKGVGKNRQLIINMDEFIDHSMDQELHLECCRGLAKAIEYKLGMVYGSMPTITIITIAFILSQYLHALFELMELSLMKCVRSLGLKMVIRGNGLMNKITNKY